MMQTFFLTSDVLSDMDDMQYAALTQMATAPLTAAYCYQIHSNKMNSTFANRIRKVKYQLDKVLNSVQLKKQFNISIIHIHFSIQNSTFTIHIVGAELPFEADTLNKWEVFFLHLRSDVQILKVVMVGPDINSSKLPLDLLRNIK